MPLSKTDELHMNIKKSDDYDAWFRCRHVYFGRAKNTHERKKLLMEIWTHQRREASNTDVSICFYLFQVYRIYTVCACGWCYNRTIVKFPPTDKKKYAVERNARRSFVKLLIELDFILFLESGKHIRMWYSIKAIVNTDPFFRPFLNFEIVA